MSEHQHELKIGMVRFVRCLATQSSTEQEAISQLAYEHCITSLELAPRSRLVSQPHENKLNEE